MTLPRQIIFALAAFGALISAADAKVRHPVKHHRIAHHRVVHHRTVRHHPVRHHQRTYPAVPEGSPVVQIEREDSGASYWQRERGGRRGPAETVIASVGNDLVAAMRRVIGMRRQPGMHAQWCGDGLALVARRAGYLVPKGFSLAANWLHAGPPLSGPRPGALAVYSHHVAVIEQWPRIISANFGHELAEGIQRITRHQRLLGFVAPVRG